MIMNSVEYCLYMNMMIIVATVLAVFISGTAWALLGLMFFVNPCIRKQEDAKVEVLLSDNDKALSE